MNKQEAGELIKVYANPDFGKQLTEIESRKIVDLYFLSIGQDTPFLPDNHHFLPIRATYKQIQGARTPYEWWELFGVVQTPNPAEGIKTAQNLLVHYFYRSTSRNISRLDILLSGGLKYPEQVKPIWLPITTMTEGEQRVWEETCRQAIIDLGYKQVN